MIALSAADRADVLIAGRDPDRVVEQLALLREGPRHRAIDRPCAVGDGIRQLDLAAQEAAIAAFDGEKFGAFVPASGAASRMFANLPDAVALRVHELAIWPSLGLPASAAADDVRSALIARWAGVPKGLVPFHPSPGGAAGEEPRTALDEQLAECEALGIPRAHFTVGPEHEGQFRARAARSSVDVDLSVQDPRTDTVALEADGSLVRTDEPGRPLLFRPGGHGALLGNVEAAGFDRALVKNIDNVVSAGHRAEVLRWRRVIGGTLELLLARIEVLYSDLLAEVPGAVERAWRFADEDLAVDVPRDRDALVLLFDRPVRVCGMVPNDGQPGGGPYFVRGSRVPQIIESAEVDPDDADQQALFRKASHFNPVDMALSLAGPSGRYVLSRFADPTAAMVTRKTYEGRSIVVLEHPGLWNGGMARWNTVFVEVPRTVFQPVKTVGDLLTAAHR